MEKHPKILVLLDGNALIHRAYHALPPLTTKNGETVQAVYGFAMTLLSVLEKFHPEYIAATFDLEGPTFRDDMYAEYKATRASAPDDLYAQIPRVKDLVRAFNIPIYEQAGFEADDVIGTLAKQSETEDIQVIIVTGDSDELQLVTPQVKVFMLRKGIKDIALYDEAAVLAKYGFGPALIPDYKGLAGDTSDNIPGVTGVGTKTATTLIQQFGTLESIYEHLSEVKESVRKKLEADQKNAFLSKELGTIHREAPVKLDLPACVARDYDRSVVTGLFQELGFFSLIKRLGGEGAKSNEERKSNPSTTLRARKEKELKTEKGIKDFLKKAQGKQVAVWAKKETESLFGAGLQSLHLALSPEDSYALAWADHKELLKEFLENEAQEKIVYDAKALMHLLWQDRIVLRGVVSDIMLSAYLLDSGSDVSLDYLVLVELGDEPPYLPAPYILRLHERYEEKLNEVSKTQTAGKTLRTVLETIELPLLPVLFAMEERGVILNTQKFKKLSDELGSELKTLEQDIYALSGREFNINSPKQLSEILFVDLQIPSQYIKKTKTGISTASSELQKLQEYPIVQKIEHYRELFKLKTTYLDALPTLVDSASRLHTTYYQAVAATGRLSSSDPNLQNIPARGEWSTRVRGAFEPAPGYVLVGADYSQIELRVMAHLSQDKELVSAFQNGEDVHKTTASVVFKMKPEDVTPDMRRQAKVFNFGILYGMGAYGLAQAAEIDQKTAAEFIVEYFKKFAGVKQFIEEMKEGARKNHFVETELGRRRYTPEIESPNVQVARGAERMAINMPVQGLAADIMKLAMLAVSRLIAERFADDAVMILQVHDELICEVKAERAEEFGVAVKEVMAGVYPLRVPLLAETEIGKNWGEI
ncbi:MAG: DNA polymerase I [Candidatus Moraniibacteriota bacterium]|nr:MAG: DNA polymerase I [Candidatus Moranbacteria bacterium]